MSTTVDRVTADLHAMSMIVQAIVTRYIGPSNTLGSRVKAQAEAGSVTISYDARANTEGAHYKAALALCDKLGWSGQLQGGGLPDGTGYCWVFVKRTK